MWWVICWPLSLLDLIVSLQENAMEEDSEDVKVLEQADSALQESLQSENVPGEMEGEQTWPTEEEMEEAEGQLTGGLTDFLMSMKHFYSSNTTITDIVIHVLAKFM